MKAQLRAAALAVILFAGMMGTAAMMPKGNKDIYHTDQMLYWFDSNTGAYLGQALESQQQHICGSVGNIECCRGYRSIIVVDEEVEPSGSVVVIIYHNE